MIETRTTFIVGAGASTPYGLPTARRLKKAATAIVEATDAWGKLCRANNIRSPQLREFLDDLRNHPAPSIDEFLETRPEQYDLGKSVIALLMFAAIKKPQSQGTETGNWLKYVLNEMRRGAPTCEAFGHGNRNINFITFNFDSVIEWHISSALRAIYRGISDDQLAATMAQIQVTHVHGQLPPIAADSQLTIDWLKDAAKRILTVRDEQDTAMLQAVSYILRNSTVVCFLGFAYEPGNLAKLGIPEVLEHGVSPDQYVAGSAYGLLEGEQKRVRDRIGRDFDIGDETQGCLEILRRFYVFQD